jgi:hypothetical protein
MNTQTVRTAFAASVAVFFATVAFGQAFPQEPYLGQQSGHGVAGVDNPNTNSAALTDGTPLSTTTIVATDNASAAFPNADAVAADYTSEAPAAEQAGAMGMGADVGVGSAKINGNNVDLYTITIPYSVRMNDRSSLMMRMPFTMTDYKSCMLKSGSLGTARAYGEGLNLGWAYRVFDKQDNVPYRWKIMPGAGIYRRTSDDLNMGSMVYNVSISSSFAWQVSSGWIFNIGNSITMAWNNGIGGYPDPIRDQQQAVLNGVQVYRIIDRWVVGAMIIDTRYLHTNLINSFQTYALSAGFKITPSRTLRFSLKADEGKGYRSVLGTIGSSWKF